tara:strand:+ start:1159 stop:1761 length:603 start_codon:yes stop_codon:yes gene_type:complete
MIKKIICFYSLSVLLIFSSYSQKFELGLKAGPNFATQKISTITNPESITGYHLGGFMYLKLPIIFGIQVEGQYSKLGSEFQINQLINKNNLGYINIPVLIRNDFGPLNLHFGPQFGIMTNALDELKNSIKSQFLDRDFSLIVGLGLRLPANFGLTVRYVKGLKNISDINVSNTETKNTVIQVSLKYSIIQLGIKKNKKNE